MKKQIFISYRRDSGDVLARMLYDRLNACGYEVFYDVESLQSGKFNEQLYSCIDECEDFIIVLSPKALDRCISDEHDWVRKEIAYALSKNKNIIPVISQDFSFPDELPNDISELHLHNGVLLSMVYTDATINKLQSLLSSRPNETASKGKPKKVKAISITLIILLAIACLVCGFLLLGNHDRQTPIVPNSPTDSIDEIMLGNEVIDKNVTSLFLYTSDIAIYDDNYELFLGDCDSNKKFYFYPSSIDYEYIEIDTTEQQLSQIQNLKQLKHLVILGAKSDNWSFISSLKSLELLTLEYNRISDISFVYELEHLISLDVGNNLVSDTSPLKELTNLKEVGLFGNQIADISPLKRLHNIYALDLSENLIDDISAINGMSELEILSMKTNNISDISPLRNCSNLQFLSLDDNSVSDISVLAELPLLQTFYATNNQITDISPLSNCVVLNEVNLSGNQISDLSPLANLEFLYYLELNDNCITDISPIANMPSMGELHLMNNDITNLEPLLYLPNLYVLAIGYGNLADISVLSQLKDLGYLYTTAGYELDDGTRLGYLSNEQYEELKAALPNCNIVTS